MEMEVRIDGDGFFWNVFYRNNVRAPGSTPQLTIFYAGTVNAFDGISPEKVLSLFLSVSYRHNQLFIGSCLSLKVFWGICSRLKRLCYWLEVVLPWPLMEQT